MSMTPMPKPMDAIDMEAFARSLQPYEGLLRGKKLAIAVSGGSDSLALLHLLAATLEHLDASLVALTVDHALRKESKNEAEHVRRCAQDLGIEHHTLTLTTPLAKSNLQEEARKARYDAMAAFCAERSIVTLCVAQHLDDQAETVMMRLLRGSGIDGLAAMKPVSHYQQLTLFRPLLWVRKKALQDYLIKQSITWCEDPSNQDDGYDRNAIRNLLATFPDPELSASRLAQTAHHMQRAQDYMQTQLDDVVAQHVTIDEMGCTAISYAKIASPHQELLYRLLCHMISIVRRNSITPRFTALSGLAENLTKPSFRRDVLAGCVFAKKKDNLHIFREAAHIDHVIQVKESGSYLWDRRFMLQVNTRQPLTIRALKEEDITALKIDKKTLSHLIDRAMVGTLPAIQTLEELVAIPHIQYYTGTEWRHAIRISFNH